MNAESEFVPSWLLLVALVFGAAAVLLAHVRDPWRDAPADWHPSAWQRLIGRLRATRLPQRSAHPDLARGIEQLEAALQRNDGRLIP